MDRYLAHDYALARQEDIKRSVKTSRTTDQWHGVGGTLTERVGRTLIHLGARLLRDETPALNINTHLPRAAA